MSIVPPMDNDRNRILASELCFVLSSLTFPVAFTHHLQRSKGINGHQSGRQAFLNLLPISSVVHRWFSSHLLLCGRMMHGGVGVGLTSAAHVQATSIRVSKYEVKQRLASPDTRRLTSEQLTRRSCQTPTILRIHWGPKSDGHRTLSCKGAKIHI